MSLPAHSIYRDKCIGDTAGRVFDGGNLLSPMYPHAALDSAQQGCIVIHAPCPNLSSWSSCVLPSVHYDSIMVAVDGACRGNGRPDATAACAIFFSQDSPYNETHVFSGDEFTPVTSQRAELMGGIKALEAAKRLVDYSEEAGYTSLNQVVIKTDSAYLMGGATVWIHKWKSRGWTNAKGAPVVNQDLFRLLEDRIETLEHAGVLVQFFHVPRHCNREADAAARRALEEVERPALIAIGPVIVHRAPIAEEKAQIHESDICRTVGLLSLDDIPFFEDMYSGLLSKLGTLAHVRRMKTAQNALEHLESAELPAAILVVDASITEQGNQKVLDKLKEYVVCGGTAIFCCHFSSFVQFSDLDAIFYSHFGLSWKAGSYTRATLCINSTATEELPSERRLTSTFSQKALHLMHVGHHSALYLTDEFICRSQTPIAWASVGRGRVGYVGDINAQEETTEVILAMCGL